MVEKPNNPRYRDVSILKPEEIELKTQYTITINIADLHGQFDIDHSKLYGFVQRYMRGIPGLDFRMYLEYSKKGRLHLHGIVMFNKEVAVMQFYENLMEMLSKASIEVDTIKDMQTWSEYLVKQESYMKLYCEKKHVIYEFTRDSVNGIETPRSKTGIERWL